MKNTEYFKGKQVTVVGIARSGLMCARLLHDIGARVSVTDRQDTPLTRANAAALKERGIEVELGRHSESFVDGRQLLVVSPGVTAENPCICRAEENGTPVIAEIEVGWLLCPATVIAITGSSGKTTVTTLIGSIITAAGKRAFVCGNIGTPFCQEVPRMQEEDYVSLEVSSFQLERIRAFKPRIALILNLSRNHLDRHRDMQEYLDAKNRIFMNQDEQDHLVLNADDPALAGCASAARSKKAYFSSAGWANPNYAAAAAVGKILGIGDGLMREVFAGFKGIEHRMEEVARVNGVTFINDSKATTAESANWALRSIPGRIVLIAGGRDKGVDYGVIAEEARKKVKEVILIGEAKAAIARALQGVAPIREAATLPEAVEKAFLGAQAGEYVLLSPMCSSFDMFCDFEERGRVFKQAVHGLSGKEKGSSAVR